MSKHIFSAPPTENLSADAQMRGQLLHTLLTGFGTITIIIIVALIAFTITDTLDIEDLGGNILYFSSALLLAGTIFIYWLNQRGYVYVGGGLFLLLIIFAITISDTPKELLAGRSLIFFVIPVMMSSFLLRSYASFLTATAITTEHALFWMNVDLDITFSPFGIIAFYAFAFISWLGARAMEKALDESYNINERLDILVGDRTRELAEANAYLESANEKLQELDALKSKFVSDVSHELRTPISNISIYLEMLEDILSKLGNNLPSKTLEFLKIVRNETSRLTKLITDVLSTSRLEQAMTNIEMQVVDVNPIVRDVVEANRLKAESKEIALSLSETNATPKLFAEPDQLKQVFTNLIANAVNYTPKGSIHVSTKVNDQNEFVFQIKDTGMGIASKDIEHLFERFYRGQQASRSSIPGTGLGLAITKEIVEAHQGAIQVESELNVGTTFTITFPIHNE